VRFIKESYQNGHPYLHAKWWNSPEMLKYGRTKMRLWEWVTAICCNRLVGQVSPFLFEGYRHTGKTEGVSRVLDISGAATPLSLYLATLGIPVVATEVNPEIIAIGERSIKSMGLEENYRQVQAGAEDMSRYLESDSFDVVLSISLLEHLSLEDQKKAVKEMKRLVRTGGQVFISFVIGRFSPEVAKEIEGVSEIPSWTFFKENLLCEGLEVVGNPPFKGAVKSICLPNGYGGTRTYASLLLRKV